MRENNKIDWVTIMLLMCLACLVACAIETSNWFQLYFDMRYFWLGLQNFLIGG